MGLPQCRFDAFRSLVASEDKPQVFRPLRQRDDLSPHGNGDPDLLDAWNTPGLLLAPDLTEDPGLRDGDHHHPGSSLFPLERLHFKPQGVTKNQLLERDAVTKAQRTGAETADGSRGNLEYPGGPHR